jgi:sarcosine oxidase, subunit gamma
MAEPAARREPLASLAPIEVRSRLRITPGPPASRYVLRGPDNAARSVGIAFGLDLPSDINRAAASADRAAFKLGPDEWLLSGPAGFELAEPPAPAPYSLVDVSHRNSSLVVSGMLAADVLSSGVMLDLHTTSFPVGMATRTLFAKAEIVLWRREMDLYHIEVWRSFAGYLFNLVNEAALEHVRS